MREQRGIFGGDTSGTSLVDVLDRVLQKGAYVRGDVVICLAGIDLARLDLRLLLTAVGPELGRHTAPPPVVDAGERGEVSA